MDNAQTATAAAWETLKSAAKRTGFAYQTFLNWKCQEKLPFPVYVNNLVRPEEVDEWVKGTKIEPVTKIEPRPSMERVKI